MHRKSRAGAISILAMSDLMRVRLDKWLWAARLFKTRSVAAEAVNSGRVRVNGARTKPAREVRPGDRIEISQRAAAMVVDVQAVSAVRGPAPVARRLYVETADSAARRESLREAHRLGAEPADALQGRPTKRDARRLKRLRDSAAD
jgi:ribosome-associated heat shock protein Hsp15